MKKNLLLFAMICTTLFLTSCSKDGPQGPEGIKGEIGALGQKGDKGDKGDAGPKGTTGNTGGTGSTGSTGSTGTTGNTGPKGDPGNANVKVYSKDILNETWTVEGTIPVGLLKLEIPAPNVLTRNAINNHVILVYVESSDFGYIWSLLPYYTDRNIRVQYDLREGLLILKRDQNGQAKTQSIFSKVRIVVIEPTSSGTINRKTPIDFKDYNAVKAYYNLED